MKILIRSLLPMLILLQVAVSQAKIEVLFHPHDPTLEKIASWLLQAQRQIDISMYNMETSEKSPVIAALKSKAMQDKIRSQKVHVRLLFEGYGTPAENQASMQALETLGIDVRTLGKTQKVHHKFAVIDYGTSNEKLITGSANWSLTSYRNYNENILFMENEDKATARFQYEFERLWKNSKAFGEDLSEFDLEFRPRQSVEDSIEVFFNSPKRIDPKSNEPTIITDQLVKVIDRAQSSIQVASTRIRLKPVLDALLRAANRGVKIQIVLSQDDYADIQKRSQWFLGNQNIEVRVKFYNLRVSQYMTYQMHNKFMIVDGNKLWTGSFNWSDSSENSHIENVVLLSGNLAQDVLPSYKQEFSEIWNMNRKNIDELEKSLAEKVKSGTLPSCGFAPTSFRLEEISNLLKQYRRCI